MTSNGDNRGSPSSAHSIENATAMSQRTPRGATAAASEQYEFNADTDIIDSGAPSFPTITTCYPQGFQPNMHQLPGNNQHQPFNNHFLASNPSSQHTITSNRPSSIISTNVHRTPTLTRNQTNAVQLHVQYGAQNQGAW